MHGTDGGDLSSVTAYLAGSMGKAARVTAITHRLGAASFRSLLGMGLPPGCEPPDIEVEDGSCRSSVAESYRMRDGRMAAADAVESAEVAAEEADVVVDGAWESRRWNFPWWEFDPDERLEPLLQEVARTAGALVVATRREWPVPSRPALPRERYFGLDIYMDKSSNSLEADMVGRPPAGTASLLVVDRLHSLWHPPVTIGRRHDTGTFLDYVGQESEPAWLELPVDFSKIEQGKGGSEQSADDSPQEWDRLPAVMKDYFRDGIK